MEREGCRADKIQALLRDTASAAVSVVAFDLRLLQNGPAVIASDITSRIE